MRREYISDIEKQLSELPANVREEVSKQILKLIRTIKKSKKAANGSTKPTLEFKWEGALEDLRDKYTSVELQHAITKMRAEKFSK